MEGVSEASAEEIMACGTGYEADDKGEASAEEIMGCRTGYGADASPLRVNGLVWRPGSRRNKIGPKNGWVLPPKGA